MKKIESMREQVRSVAARWRDRHSVRIQPNARRTLLQLQVLDVETATAADVERIIGNTTWCAPMVCDECHARRWLCVEFVANDKWGDAPHLLCIDCLREGLALLEAPK